MKIIVTTSQSVNNMSIELRAFLLETQWEFVPRQRKSLEFLAHEHKALGVAVWHEEGPILHLQGEKFFFHPSMAKNRLTAYRKQQISDPLIKACDLQSRDSFLDCTLGMGADSIVVSYFTEKRVTSLESSFPIAMMIKWGMKTYRSRISWLAEPISKIDVTYAHHYNFLKAQKDCSYDIVYFDPMFRHPILDSQPLAPLRILADHDPLTRDSIAEACRVAKKRVVMKELARSDEMKRLGFEKFAGSPNNRIGYGVIEV
ncbi:MAG TPA: class I SAM-dependent methyltransferase [Syntrophomonadaceae bacterium]|nr:class I SAM-dependent methyltransferase [Syntrophomonadaceae bacterium]